MEAAADAELVEAGSAVGVKVSLADLSFSLPSLLSLPEISGMSRVSCWTWSRLVPVRSAVVSPAWSSSVVRRAGSE